MIKRSIWVTDADGIEFPHAAQAMQTRRDGYDLTGAVRRVGAGHHAPRGPFQCRVRVWFLASLLKLSTVLMLVPVPAPLAWRRYLDWTWRSLPRGANGA